MSDTAVTDTAGVLIADLRNYRSAGVRGARLTICDRAADFIQHSLPEYWDWQPMASAPTDGTLLELVVDYSEGDHPMQDAQRACTIGFNNLDNTGEDTWQFAGWCWCHDHFTEGRGMVIAWRHSRLNACDDGLPPLPVPQ